MSMVSKWIDLILLMIKYEIVVNCIVLMAEAHS